MTGQDWLSVLLFPGTTLVLVLVVLFVSWLQDRRWQGTEHIEAQQTSTLSDVEKRVRALEVALAQQGVRTAAE